MSNVNDYLYESDITFLEMFLSLRRFSKISIFNTEIKVPKKNIDELKDQIESLETIVKLLDYEVKVESNNSAINIIFKNSNIHAFTLQLALHCFVVDADREYDGNGKLKRIQIFAYDEHYRHFIKLNYTSYNFAQILKYFQSLL